MQSDPPYPAHPPYLTYFVKVAFTDLSALIVTEQVPAAFVQAPLQPRKLLPAGAVAVSVTTVPEA